MSSGARAEHPASAPSQQSMTSDTKSDSGTNGKEDIDGLATSTVPIDLSRTGAYRIYLFAIAIVPLPLLLLSVRQAQLIYAVLGAFFMPLLALTLLLMNNRTRWVGKRFRNGIAANAVLVATLGLFGYLAISKGFNYLLAVTG